MNSIESNPLAIVAREVADSERIQVLPRHFGRHMLTVEYAIFAFMRKLSPRYTGGYWAYYELENGGFYMAPQSDSRFLIAVDTNDFAGEMSSDAAGITACLFALSHLSFQVRNDQIVEHFHLLRDFALEHAEAGVILAAID
ncbi:MAG: antirestriction protein [Pseudomonadota bacterium]|nr:antirestriction protein [Pseudomonadota bacterium]